MIDGSSVQMKGLDLLLSDDASEKLHHMLDTITMVQQGAYNLAVSEDDGKMKLLRIGSVFQIFLIDTLASGKKPSDLTKEDWAAISAKVGRYAVLEDGQSYSIFVFTLYADYIALSVEKLRTAPIAIDEKRAASIMEIADSIRHNSQELEEGNITEVAYVEACLWLSLEGMMKLLASWITAPFAKEYATLVQSAAQLAFEYGRYVLFSKEQALLARYIANQHELDEQLEKDYAEYLQQVQLQAAHFQELLDGAFSTDLHESLLQSAALAREAGVREEELLSSVEDIDAFFL